MELQAFFEASKASLELFLVEIKESILKIGTNLPPAKQTLFQDTGISELFFFLSLSLYFLRHLEYGFKIETGNSPSVAAPPT